jgi:CAAX protease family protein
VNRKPDNGLRTADSAFVVLLYTALSLVLYEYVLRGGMYRKVFPNVTHPLGPFAWWVGGIVVLWIVIPLLIGRRLGFSLPALGLSFGTLRRWLWVFGALYLAMLIGLLWASRQPSFLQTYPLLRVRDPAQWTWTVLLVYWTLYIIQFVGVEVFFRGFMIFTLHPRFGNAAIAVMVIPYTTIHFGKPMAESLGAIVAGVVLGWLALRARSIWGGVALHVAIAMTMDCLAMGNPAGVGWP